MLNSFSLDGVDLEDFGLYIGTQGNSGLLKETFIPNSTDVTETVAGMNGAYHYGKTITPRKIEIPCYIDQLDETNKLKLQKILYAKKNKKLIFDDKPHKYIYVISDGEVNFDHIQYRDYQSGFIVLNYIAYDPMMYSYYTALDYELHQDYIYDYHSIFNNLGVLPSEVPSCSLTNITDNINFSLYNHGNSDECKLSIGLVGSGTDIVITNTTNGKSFTLSSMSNENILVNHNKGQITNGIINNGLIEDGNTLKTNLFSGNFITLNCEVNNFTLSATSLNLTSVKFYYRHTYL